MEITLTQTQTQVLETLIQQGCYSSIEDALDTALLLLVEEMTPASLDESLDDPSYSTWVNATRQKIEAAREQAQRGKVLSVETVLTQLREKVGCQI